MVTEIASVFLLLLLAGLLRQILRLWDAVVRRPATIARDLQRQGLRVLPYNPLSLGNALEIRRSADAVRGSPLPTPPAGSHASLLSHLFPFTVPQLSQGDSFVFWWGPWPRFVLTNPDFVKQVLSTEFKSYSKLETLSKQLRRLFGYGLLLADGQDWQNKRNIVRPAFFLEKIKMMVADMHYSTMEMVNQWTEVLQRSGGRACEVDVAEHFKNLTGDILARTCFGSDYRAGKSVFEKQHMLVPIMLKQALMHLLIPGYRYLPFPANLKAGRLERSIENELYKIVKERLENPDTAGKNDLLGLMIQGEEKSYDQQAPQLTARQVMDECKTFFFAGHETTANLLCWTMMLLSAYPDWQDKLRNEVMDIFGCAVGSTQPHTEQLNKLRLMTMVLNEALRLYPPVPELSPRTPLSESSDNAITLGKVVFPRDVGFTIPVAFIHRNKDLWGENAHEFCPERFSDGVSKACKHPFAFLPFALGPRVCIGQNFAMLEAKVIMVAILGQFRFRLSPSYVHCPESLITLRPKYGMPVILEPL